MNDKSEGDYISFRSDLTWSADDLIALTSSVSTIYNVFLAYYLRSEHERQYYKRLERQLEEYHHLYERYLDHPIYYDFLKYWRRLLKDWMQRRGPFPPPPYFPLPFPFQQQQIEVKIPSEDEIFDKIRRYSSERERLRIYKIRISSPGGFSFAGLGEIIREFRELIKDIWYRNKQEKTKGQLEIIDKYLCMRREHSDTNLPPLTSLPSGGKLAEVIDVNVETLKRLESDGKLRSIPEHLDYDPDLKKQ
jgi:hypothetical protein